MQEENPRLLNERTKRIVEVLYVEAAAAGPVHYDPIVECAMKRISLDDVIAWGKRVLRQAIRRFLIRLDTAALQADIDRLGQMSFEGMGPTKANRPQKIQFEEEPGVPVTLRYGFATKAERDAAEEYFQRKVVSVNQRYFAWLKKQNARYDALAEKYGDLPNDELDRLDDADTDAETGSE